MESYRPPRKSKWKSYLTDPLLYLAVALVVIGVSIGVLYKKDRSNLTQKGPFLKGTLQIASTNGSDSDRLRSRGEVPSPPSPPPPPAISSTTTASPPSSPTAAIKTAVTGTSGFFVRIYYAEVPRRSLEKLYEESQDTGQFNSFGDYTAGILPEVAQRVNSSGLKIRILEKVEKAIGKTQQLFTGVHDSELAEYIGFNTVIELADTDNDTIRGNLEIIRNWKDGGERSPASLQKSSFPAVFEMNHGAGFFISGIMPRGPSPHGFGNGAPDDIAKIPTFEILKSRSFQNKESEFVIFVEFDKKP
ncbi:MAG: hypothetical protein IPM97_13685 [Bdellovibrionaceae bacterium]|nr:hypothetical protein [Pseudobdellovibrionaceae bacterium]